MGFPHRIEFPSQEHRCFFRLGTGAPMNRGFRQVDLPFVLLEILQIFSVPSAREPSLAAKVMRRRKAARAITEVGQVTVVTSWSRDQ
jgi:hypothetical protein